MKKIKKLIKYRNYFLVKVLIILLSLTFLGLLTKSVHILAGTDDAVLSGLMRTFSVPVWVGHQYVTWSGRITAETLISTFYRLPLWVWKIGQMAIFFALIIILYRYYTLLSSGTRTPPKDLTMLSVAAFSPLLMNVGALRWGAFWVTGSLNYLWIATLALISFYPLLYTYINRKYPPIYMMIIGVISGILAGMGQEQVYLLLCLFSIGITLTLFLDKRRTVVYPVVQTLFTLFAAIGSYLAPGNQKRLASEMHTYIPNFHTAPLFERMDWNYRWFVDAMINHCGYLLPLLWIVIIALLYKVLNTLEGKGMRSLSRIVILLLLIGTVLLCKVIPIISPTNFYVAWGVTGMPLYSYLYLLFWSAVLVATVLGVYLIARKYNKNTYALPAVFLGVMIGAGAMVASPTMYASGPRTMLVPSMLLIVLVVILMNYFLTEYRKQRTLLLGMVITMSLLTYISLSAAIQGVQA